MPELDAKPRRLNVLLWHWGRRGGGPRYTFELARALQRSGAFELHLSTSRQAEMREELRSLRLPGFEVDTYGSLAEAVWRTPALPAIARRFRRYLRDAQVDLVFCTMNHVWNPAMAGVLRQPDVRYLLAVHDAMPHPGEDTWLRRVLLHADVGAADGALALVEPVRRQLVEELGVPVERSFVAPHGPFWHDANAVPRTLPADRPVRVLFFGRILLYKGLDILLGAMRLLEQESLGLELEIWGAGDLGPYADALAGLARTRVENRWIAEAEVPAIFRRADICILPYREASQSGVAPTSLGAGVPVVVTPLRGLVEQIIPEANGLVAAAATPEALAASIRRLATDRALYARLSRGALDACDGVLGWAAAASRVTAAIEAVAAMPKRRSAARLFAGKTLR
jgi:glycosyltransferase involved in cell wall biosynthesis